MEFSTRDVRPRSLAVVRVTTALALWPSQFRQELDKVYEAVRAGHVVSSGHNVMLYRHRRDGLVDIECGIETAGRFAGIGEVVYRETPAGTVVTATHVGPYRRLRETHDAVVAWAGTKGHRLSGVCWEVYGDWSPDPAKLETEVFHLVR